MRTNVHHKRQKKEGGKTNQFNCVRVDAKRHELFHKLFEGLSSDEIMVDLNHYWLDPRYVVINSDERG